MLEIIKLIWHLKWWEVFIIAGIDDIFLLVKIWPVWIGIGGIVLFLVIYKNLKR